MLQSRRISRLERELQDLRTEVQWLRENPVNPAAGGSVSPHVTLGADCRIAPGVHLMAAPERPISIGDRVVMYRGAEAIGPVSIGDRSFINRDAYIRSGTAIGADVAVGPFVRFVTDSHEPGTRAKRAGRNVWLPIKVGDGCWIGAGAIILGGVTIGDGCVVGAGAVVTRDVPDQSLVAGVPATVRRTLD